MKTKFTFGVIGAGNMGFAIANGAIKEAVFDKTEVVLYDAYEKRAQELTQLGFNIAKSSIDVFENSEIVLLAIKPQMFEEVLTGLKSCESSPLIISVAAGITTDYIKKYVGEIPVVRVMPNTPLLIGAGATAIAKNKLTDKKYLEITKRIFDTLGVTVVFDEENMLNEVIPSNGSAPAYVYYFINEMIKSAVAHGIDYDDAKKLVVKTFIGSAKMVENHDGDIKELINAVCSPGGTTLEAMKVFDDRNIGEIISHASDKCIKRSYELSK